MKKEKISECISLINDTHLDEAACYVKDVYFNNNTETNNKERLNIKKSKAVAVICIAAAIAVISTVVVCVSAKRSVNGPPTEQEKLASDYVDDYVPTEKDKMRSEYKTELHNRLDKIRQEMLDGGKDKKTAYNEASEQVLLEQIGEIADILKKYNKVNSDFKFRGIDDNVTGIRAACELLNSSESLTVRETVVLEIYIEDGYFTLRELGGYDDLMNWIRDTVRVRYVDY